MRVRVEACWNGSTLYFCLTAPDGRRCRVNGETWNRKVAREARDLASLEFGAVRSAIRFTHH